MMTKVSSSVAAQDRMPPIPRGQLSDAQKQAIAEFKDVRKADVSGPFTPLLRSPEVMNRARAMGDYLRWNSALPPRLSEFALGISGHYTLLAMVLNAARTPLPAGRQPALAPFPH